MGKSILIALEKWFIQKQNLKNAKKDILQGHKASGNHDFAAQDDSQGPQKTLPRNVPVRQVKSGCLEKQQCEITSWNVLILLVEGF